MEQKISSKNIKVQNQHLQEISLLKLHESSVTKVFWKNSYELVNKLESKFTLTQD